LGKGGYGTVRCSAHRLLGTIAVKCFSVSGGYAEKETIARMYGSVFYNQNKYLNEELIKSNF